MKHTLIILTFLFLLAAPAVLAQSSYDLPWWTVDGGGGSSSGEGYNLSGSIGQAEAGTLSGGSYTLSGGFWFGQGAAAGPGQINVYLPLVLK